MWICHFTELPERENPLLQLWNETEGSYTSQNCPFCGGRHQAGGRNYIYSVHKTEIHHDVNKAKNIARKIYPMEVKPMESVVYKQPVWYKRHLLKKKGKKPNILRISLKR